MKQINSKWITVSLIACCFFAQKTDAQINDANISGSFQLNLQNSQQNTAIGAQEVKEGILSNAYADIFYNWKNFRAGLRYEYYSPPTLNLDRRFEGQGIATRFVNFKKDKFEFTLGNFYDQYGSGLIFRSYEERSLGYDNAMNGVQVKYNPTPGVYLKGMVGKQRTFWEYSDGYTRGLDGEFNLNDLNLLAKDCDLNVDLGASFVSKYQQSTSTLYNMPLNVGAYSLRAALQYKKVAADVEFVGKSQDPSAQNNYVLSKGKGLLINSSYSTRGFGASLSLKHVDNMDFRSDREQSGQVLLVNYNPALTKQNTWALTTFFPYPTVNLGETGLLAEINYKVPKKSLGVLGGTYLTMSYASSYDINRTVTDSVTIIDAEAGTSIRKASEHTSSFFDRGTYADGEKKKFFEEFYIEASKKINKKTKGTLGYLYTYYNTDLNAGISNKDGARDIYAQVIVAEMKYKIASKKSIRIEAQHLQTKQFEKNWAMFLAEYSHKGYFVAVQNLYNYEGKEKLNYPTLSAGFTKGSTQLRATYGKQRAGLFCVGGVCTNVPASDGLTVTLTSNF